jgi:hypothetical protein
MFHNKWFAAYWRSSTSQSLSCLTLTCKLNPIVFVQQNILRFNVAVDNRRIAMMQVAQSLDKVHDNGLGACLVEPAFLHQLCV